MKEKIQGLAERKAFILLFVYLARIVFLVWKVSVCEVGGEVEERGDCSGGQTP